MELNFSRSSSEPFGDTGNLYKFYIIWAQNPHILYKFPFDLLKTTCIRNWMEFFTSFPDITSPLILILPTYVDWSVHILIFNSKIQFRKGNMSSTTTTILLLYKPCCCVFLRFHLKTLWCEIRVHTYVCSAYFNNFLCAYAHLPSRTFKFKK